MNVRFGLGCCVPGGAVRGLRAATEFALPASQDLDEPQMDADFSPSVGARYLY